MLSAVFIALEFFGKFAIYGHPEVVLFLTVIITGSRLSCEMVMGNIFSAQ